MKRPDLSRAALVLSLVLVPTYGVVAACYIEDTVGWPCPADPPPLGDCWHQLVGDSVCFEPLEATNGFTRAQTTALCEYEWKTKDANGNCTVTHPNYKDNRPCHAITGTTCKNGGAGNT
jgi:hypothetical protein